MKTIGFRLAALAVLVTFSLPAAAVDVEAAKALAALSPAAVDKTAPLLPPVSDLREVAIAVALAVALQAQKDGVAEPMDPAATEARIRAHVWEPRYRQYRKLTPVMGG